MDDGLHRLLLLQHRAGADADLLADSVVHTGHALIDVNATQQGQQVVTVIGDSVQALQFDNGVFLAHVLVDGNARHIAHGLIQRQAAVDRVVAARIGAVHYDPPGAVHTHIQQRCLGDALGADQLDQRLQRIHRVPRREFNLRLDLAQIGGAELMPAARFQGEGGRQLHNAVNSVF